MDVRSTNQKLFELQQKKRERSSSFLAAVTSTLVASGRRDMVEGHLTDAIRLGWIDFFVLTYRGEVTLYNSRWPLSDAALATISDLHPPDAFWEFDSKVEAVRSIRGPASKNIESNENFRFLESDLGDDRRLKLGFNLDREAFLADAIAETESEDRRVYVLTLLIVLGVFLFSARDLLRVAKAVRTKGVAGLKDIRVFSKEAAALQQGLQSYGEVVDRLELRNKTLTAQVLPSLRSELESGKVPPYDFDCTMVRTDINNFTKIFHSHPVDEFLATINEFFTECSHIISRYEGLIHEFVGDEIIFYFKDVQHSNSFTAALACTREMELIAEKIHERTHVEGGYAFRVKSSLAHGKIRFGPLLNGFSLAGAPLIETTRILSHVNEKNENTIHFDSANALRVHDRVVVAEAFRAVLKGMDGERLILRFEKRRELDLSSPTSIDDWRSDEHLEVMLKEIGRSSGSEGSVKALHLLGKLHITRCSTQFLTFLKMTIERLMKMDRKVESIDALRALATLAASLPRLVPAEHFEMFQETLLALLEDPDGRVVANSIESLQEFRTAGVISRRLGEQLLESRNTRVSTNALVYKGTIEISDDVIRRVRKLLSTADVNKVIAGLFAWGEIAAHHLANDPVYLRTQSDFLDIAKDFRDITRRVPSAEKAACEAAQKAGDVDLAARLARRPAA